MRRRVVVTGVGMVTPLGGDLQATWQNVLDARSAIGTISRFDPAGFPVRFAAQAPAVSDGADWLADRGVSAGLARGRKSRLTVAALREALDMSGFAMRGDRVAVCLGSEAARPELGDLAARMKSGELPTAAELSHLAPDAPTRLVAAALGATGPRSTTSTACTSSSQAVGEALLRIRRGEVDAAVAGGVDVLVDPIMVTGFARLGALSTRNDDPAAASRPFDRDRDGFVLGEGAGFLILEEAGVAIDRGATILAELSGFGCSCNAWRITDSPPDGRGAAQAMTAALADARLRPQDVDYINAHGTSTQMNDSSETAGIHRAFGVDFARSVPVSSTKSMMGHLVAACGAVEAILCLQAVREGILPPGINLDNPDPKCDLNHVGGAARPARVRHTLTNAFGFGGSNGSLVLSAWEGG
jgi:3-oxoacyl-[acyl-carrier-protein] synthase II